MMFHYAGYVFQPSIIEKEKRQATQHIKIKAKARSNEYGRYYNSVLNISYYDIRFLDNAYLPFRMRLLTKAAVCAMRCFYGSACSYINYTVTCLRYNLLNGVNIGDT